MILDKFVLKMRAGEVTVIGNNLIIVVVAKFKIRLIKNLVLLDVPK